MDQESTVETRTLGLINSFRNKSDYITLFFPQTCRDDFSLVTKWTTAAVNKNLMSQLITDQIK